MVGYKYYTVLTDIGKQKLTDAIANENILEFTEMAIGDANGISYEPTSDMTALKHETYRATISSSRIDEIDRNIMIFELVVPTSSGGYYMREAGLFSQDGTMIAIARIAEQYKPQVSEGAGSSITISMRIAISSKAQVYINVPESISYATQNFVVDKINEHLEEENPHNQYVFTTYANETFATKDDLNNKADRAHNHDEVYSAVNHTHEDTYSDINHNHDDIYIKKGESSGDFAPANHNHDESYSKLNHTHTGYAASGHTHSNYAVSNHNHDSVYMKKEVLHQYQ